MYSMPSNFYYLIVSLVFSHLGFWSGNLFLIAPFPDLCLLVPLYINTRMVYAFAIGKSLIPSWYLCGWGRYSIYIFPTTTFITVFHAFCAVGCNVGGARVFTLTYIYSMNINKSIKCSFL